MSKTFKRIAVFMVVAFIAPMLVNFIPAVNSLTAKEATAAVAKAKLTATEAVVGINSSPMYIFIDNSNQKAVYKYSSANKKIATVDKYGYVCGVSKGKTKITVTETIKKVTKKLGTVSISVLGAKPADKSIEVGVNTEGYLRIDYMNRLAKYKYTVSDNKVVKVDQYGSVKGLKKGKSTVSITETYKGKSTKIGSVTVTVVDSYISSGTASITIGVNSSNNFFDIIEIDHRIWDASYTCESSDSNIVATATEENSYGDKYFKIKGIALGTTTLTVFEEYNGVKRTVGTMNVTVKEIPVTAFSFETDYLDLVNGELSKTFYLGHDYSYMTLKDYITVKPFDTTTTITYSSSDENVIKVDSTGSVTPVGVGSATITATCGSFTSQLKAIVEE